MPVGVFRGASPLEALALNLLVLDRHVQNPHSSLGVGVSGN